MALGLSTGNWKMLLWSRRVLCTASWSVWLKTKKKSLISE
jgi:hypothetical protein